eukprot:775080-Rhodomonas_salina.1
MVLGLQPLALCPPVLDPRVPLARLLCHPPPLVLGPQGDLFPGGSVHPALKRTALAGTDIGNAMRSPVLTSAILLPGYDPRDPPSLSGQSG